MIYRLSDSWGKMVSGVLGILWLCLSGTLVANPTFFKGYTTCKTAGMIALTFDDGVTKNYTPLLEVLNDYQAKATFFVIGSSLKHPRNLTLLKKVYAKGHLIANHTWDHKALTQLTDKQIEYQIRDTQNGLNLVVLPTHKLYIRPPYGKLNQSAYNKLTSMGYRVVLWNLDIDDWNHKISKSKLWAFYYKHLSVADPHKHSFIILQHDRRMDSIKILPDIINLGRSRGFKFVTLEECLR